MKTPCAFAVVEVEEGEERAMMAAVRGYQGGSVSYTMRRVW